MPLFSSIIFQQLYNIADSLVAGKFIGATGIWCAWPVGWSVAAVLSICFYSHGPWRNRTQ